MATETYRTKTAVYPELLARLEAMTPEERLAASRSSLRPHERAIWAARYPDEVPLVNGEYEWLVLQSPDCE